MQAAFNADRSLVYLPPFVRKTYGGWNTHLRSGACLVRQLASIHQEAHGIDRRLLQRAINRRLQYDYWPECGSPLADTAMMFNGIAPSLTGGVVHSPNTAHQALERGAIMMLAVDSQLVPQEYHVAVARLEDYALVRHVSIHNGHTHAFLVVGYDYVAKQYICRESRPSYTKFKGMIKFPAAGLLKYRRGIRMIELTFN